MAKPSGLSSSHGDDKNGEHLTADQITIHIGRKRHQVDVHGIEHQLDAHQHTHGIAAVDQTPTPMQNKIAASSRKA